MKNFFELSWKNELDFHRLEAGGRAEHFQVKDCSFSVQVVLALEIILVFSVRLLKCFLSAAL